MAKRQKNLKSAKESTAVAEPSEFDKLLRFIVNFQGRFALAFIRGEDRGQREGVLASLADLLKEKEIKLLRIDLTFRQSTDLLNTLKSECRQSDHGAIVVTGVEASLNDDFLASLNIQRDLISQQIKCPILFWMSNFALNLFARETPDFYDFRQTVFNFSSPQTRDLAQTPERLPYTSMPVDAPTDDSTNRTNQLLSQLEKYQKNEQSLGTRERLVYAELLEEIGRSYRDHRHRTEAIPYLQKALSIYTIYTAVGDRSRQAAVLSALGSIYYYSDNQTKAAENFNTTIAIHREIGNRLGEANALKSLGDVKSAQSDCAEAERLYQQALPIHREIGNRLGEANALKSLGDVKSAQSDCAEAERFYQQALPIHRQIGDRLGEANALKSLGDVKSSQSDYAEAERLYQQALSIHREIGDRLGEANALKSLGDVKSAQSDYAEADRLYQQALSIHREIGDRLGEANALQNLGDVKSAQSDYAEAERLYQQALPIHREIGDRLGEANALKSLGDVKKGQTKYSEGEELLLRAMGIFAAIDDDYSQGTTLLSLANLYRAIGSKQKAESAARRARDLFKSSPRMVERADRLLQELI